MHPHLVLSTIAITAFTVLAKSQQDVCEIVTLTVTGDSIWLPTPQEHSVYTTQKTWVDWPVTVLSSSVKPTQQSWEDWSSTISSQLWTSSPIVTTKPTKSDSICTTHVGLTSVRSIPSSTHTITKTISILSTVCPTQTLSITPSPTTSTITSTTTSTVLITNPQLTNTVTTTETDTVINTQTNTATTTSTTTTTVPTVISSTTTVPTPAGFTPVSQEVGYVPKHKRHLSKHLAPRGDAAYVARIQHEGGPVIYSPALFPTAVDCVVFVESTTTQVTTNSKCATTSTTTLPASTFSVISTSTVTTTSNIFRSNATSTVTSSTTITSTTTTTSTSTSTITSTSTTTSNAPVSTFYAACASNNLVNSANGGEAIVAITFAPPGSGNTISIPAAATPYDCCALCQQTTNCIWSAFAGGCQLTMAPTCDPSSAHSTNFQTQPDFDIASGYTVSNGPCGQIADGGEVGFSLKT